MDKFIIMKFLLYTGEVKVEAYGFKGSSCQDAMKFLQDSLGDVSDFQRKADWYETNLQHGHIDSNLCG